MIRHTTVQIDYAKNQTDDALDRHIEEWSDAGWRLITVEAVRRGGTGGNAPVKFHHWWEK